MHRKVLRSYLIPYVLRALFGKRVTVQYPFGPLELPDSFRGAVAVDLARCVGCGRCARDCPTGALRVWRLDNGGVRFEHAYDRCANCGQCELSCPRGAVQLVAAFRRGEERRERFVSRWSRAGEPAGRTAAVPVGEESVAGEG